MLILSEYNDPYLNLSIEEALFQAARVGGPLCEAVKEKPILYLWVNKPCVVIGRNQNIYRECRLDAMEKDGVVPVRRDTGGGAVYHDFGNLLFSFIMPGHLETSYSYGLCIDALKSLGIECAQQGRNDITALGRKFSGSAYMNAGGAALHHGTMLISSDLGRLAEYLAPSKLKLQAKGVASVGARVVNLSEIVPGVTVDDVKGALIQAYGGEKPSCIEDVADWGAIQKRAGERAAWDFLYGATPPFDILLEERISIGEIQIHLSLSRARISGAKVFTDALDPEIAGKLEKALFGVTLEASALSAATKPVSPDIADWLAGIRI